MASLKSALHGCKVNTGWANRHESDRFQNKDLMVCPVWNSHDNYGRTVKDHSALTKIGGCHLASDRVSIENGLRNDHFQKYTLGNYGIKGDVLSKKFDLSNLSEDQIITYNQELRRHTIMQAKARDVMLKQMSGMD
tara:strand:+ start:160 stop:567 length:408 start_codon:yes stop_codon:yes gene_type:complete